MQEFNPECTINLYLESRGKTAKAAWCCSLVGGSGDRIIAAARFVGKGAFDDAVVGALKFGLEQAKRLRMEKVHLATDLSVEALITPKKGRLRDPELQAKAEACAEIWGGFRLRKLVRLNEAERGFLRTYSERFFRRAD